MSIKQEDTSDGSQQMSGLNLGSFASVQVLKLTPPSCGQCYKSFYGRNYVTICVTQSKS
jgi:hypothetical protein